MKALKTISTVAVIVLVAGVFIALLGFAVNGFTFKNVSNQTKETHTVSIPEGTEIKEIFAEFDTGVISVEISDTQEKLSITYETIHTKDGDPLTTVRESIRDGAIRLEEESHFTRWIFNILDSSKTNVSIVIPKALALSLNLECDTGKINLNGGGVLNKVKLATDTGDIFADGITASDFSIELDTGDIYLKNTSVNGRFSINSDTGDMNIQNLTANSIEIETDSGDIALRDVTSATSINIELDTGDLDLKGNITAQSIYYEADTGDLDCDDGSVIDAQSITAKTSTGDLELRLRGSQNEYGIVIDIRTGDSNIRSQQGGPRQLNIKSSTGDAEIRFVG